MNSVGFRGDKFFLSNFYPCSVTYEGKTYRSSEAAFQAAKTLDVLERDKFTALSASNAKSRGRKIKLRSDWEDVKLEVMYDVCFAKFSQNEDLKQKLIDTGFDWLSEKNDWGDKFWGEDMAGYGLNYLGRILMAIRRNILLNKCPDCSDGGRPILKTRTRVSNVGWGKSYLVYQVECSKCGKKGKEFCEAINNNPDDSAIEAWNNGLYMEEGK